MFHYIITNEKEEIINYVTCTYAREEEFLINIDPEILPDDFSTNNSSGKYPFKYVDGEVIENK
jgi:hypothetical protein